MNIRKEHQRLDCIMQMIYRADAMSNYCQTIPWPEMGFKYIRVRSRLYQAYASQLAKMCQKAIAHEAA